MQLAQSGIGIGGLQQRAVGVVAGATPQVVDRGAELNDRAAGLEQVPVVRVQDHPTAGSQDVVLERRQLYS